MFQPIGATPRWRVLIIDDSRFERALIRHLLEAEGIDMAEAEDAETGVALAQEARPDLILLDYRMPGWDGFEAIRRLKADPRTAAIPVILVSATSDVIIRAEGLDLGAVDFLVKPVDPVELRARVRVALRTKRMQDQLERRASIDGLTGLANRLALDDWLRSAWSFCERRAAPLAAVVADLDHFKQINDRYGHGVGDEVLRRFAATLREGIRLTDFIARYGGEEFVVMALDCRLPGAIAAAERIRSQSAALALEFGGRPLRVTSSIGVATTCNTPAENPAELIAAADRALYAAKMAGRNAVWFWDGEESRPSSEAGPQFNDRSRIPLPGPAEDEGGLDLVRAG